MANNENLKPFKKGKDPRRNMNGRPKSFDKLRKMALRVAGQDAAEKDGEILSRVELMFMAMSTSKNAADRRLFLEYAFGKVKDEVDVNSKDIIEVTIKRNESND